MEKKLIKKLNFANDNVFVSKDTINKYNDNKAFYYKNIFNPIDSIFTSNANNFTIKGNKVRNKKKFGFPIIDEEKKLTMNKYEIQNLLRSNTVVLNERIPSIKHIKNEELKDFLTQNIKISGNKSHRILPSKKYIQNVKLKFKNKNIITDNNINKTDIINNNIKKNKLSFRNSISIWNTNKELLKNKILDIKNKLKNNFN